MGAVFLRISDLRTVLSLLFCGLSAFPLGISETVGWRLFVLFYFSGMRALIKHNIAA